LFNVKNKEKTDIFSNQIFNAKKDIRVQFIYKIL